MLRFPPEAVGVNLIKTLQNAGMNLSVPIGKILNVKTAGLTNIEEALKKGVEELESVQAREHVGGAWESL